MTATEPVVGDKTGLFLLSVAFISDNGPSQLEIVKQISVAQRYPQGVLLGKERQMLR